LFDKGKCSKEASQVSDMASSGGALGEKSTCPALEIPDDSISDEAMETGFGICWFDFFACD